MSKIVCGDLTRSVIFLPLAPIFREDDCLVKNDLVRTDNLPRADIEPVFQMRFADPAFAALNFRAAGFAGDCFPDTFAFRIFSAVCS